MLDALKFVQGAVARREDLVPTLRHFRIEGGTILGFNGVIALQSPIALDLTCYPVAEQLVRAIRTCKETVQLHLTPAGRLSVKSGAFSAFIECIPEPFPDVHPEGERLDLHPEFFGALSTLAPFMAEDASRPWARCVLFKGRSAYVTNNIILAERWIGTSFPRDVSIPSVAVEEILRIGEPPTSMQVADASVTFHFPGDRWLRSALTTGEWPPIDAILDREASPLPLPAGFFDALRDLLPFCEDRRAERVFLRDGRLATTTADGTGASVEVPGVSHGGCYSIRQLLLLEDVAEKIDLTQYPSPCLFYGDRLRGAIVGMRE